MTKLEQKSKHKELKEIMKQAWSTEGVSDEEKASSAISVPTHYRKYIVEDRKILLQTPVIMNPGSSVSYDCPDQ